MRMLVWSNKLIADSRGTTAVEFGLLFPFLVLLFSGMLEIGRAYFQAEAIEKGVRAGALYASRHTMPLSAAIQTATENLVKTGTLDGSGPYLVSGWGRIEASVDVDTSKIFTVDTTDIPVVRITASVPFDPIFPGLASLVGLKNFTMVSSHEQAWLGN